MTIALVITEIGKLNSKEKSKLVELALMNSVSGRKCAVCGYEYKTPEDCEKHEPRMGHKGSIVGEQCWDKYLEKYGGIQK